MTQIWSHNKFLILEQLHISGQENLRAENLIDFPGLAKNFFNLPTVSESNKHIFSGKELNKLVGIFNCEQFNQSIFFVKLPSHRINFTWYDDQMSLIIEFFWDLNVFDKLLCRHLVTDKVLKLALGLYDFP